MNLPDRPGRITYSPALGEWIAARVAEGSTVASLHASFPAQVPSALTVQAWRESVPAFGRLMVAADKARAGAMADETVTIADSPRQAARARNAIQARQWLAERLDRDRFGARVSIEGSMRATVEHIHRVPDAELHSIIAEARGRTLEHEPAAPVGLIEGGHPPAAQSGTPRREADEGPIAHLGKIR